MRDETVVVCDLPMASIASKLNKYVLREDYADFNTTVSSRSLCSRMSIESGGERIASIDRREIRRLSLGP